MIKGECSEGTTCGCVPYKSNCQLVLFLRSREEKLVDVYRGDAYKPNVSVHKVSLHFLCLTYLLHNFKLSNQCGASL